MTADNHMNNIAYTLLLTLMLASNMPGQRFLSERLPCFTAVRLTAPPSPTFEVDTKDVLIRDGWVQEVPPSQKITAAYLTIENRSGADISLQAAKSEVAQVVELHKMELTDGMMKMRKVETIDIAAGGTVELKPGGYHLMVIGLKKELKEGDMISITLQFSHDIRKTITIPVKPRSAMVKED